MDVQYSKESLASPDGTPPSQPSLSDDFRSNYGAVSAPRRSVRRPWLGSEVLSGVDKAGPPPKSLNGHVNGYGMKAADQPDLLSAMEASWFGKSAWRQDSSSSGFSGFHDSAASMSPHDTKSHPASLQGLANGDHSAHSSNGGSGSSGRSTGRSVGSSGGRRAAPLAGDAAETVAQRGQPGMGALPEDSDVITMQQDSALKGSQAQGRRKSREGAGWLGTWANRQVHYSKGRPPQPSLPAHIPGTPKPLKERPKEQDQKAERPESRETSKEEQVAKAQSHAAEAEADERDAGEAADQAAASQHAPEGQSSEAPSMRSKDSADLLAEDEDALRQAAWRWRFNRRWAQEQARQMDPEYGRQAGDEDGWDEALGYMDACGPGWHLQIARTTSDDGLANESLRSLSNCMLSDSTRSRHLAATTSDTPSMGEATKGIMQKARMAKDLYEQQAAIESQVKERWDTASNAGISWAGQDISAVVIDKFGKFPYVLVKLSDRMAGNKLIVRGKNGRSEPQLVSAVSKEVLSVTAKGRLPQASVTLMGSGLMEWSRERDRVINVSAGKVVAGMDGSIHSRDDVARLTAALTRASLPMHYRVTLDSERVAQ